MQPPSDLGLAQIWLAFGHHAVFALQFQCLCVCVCVRADTEIAPILPTYLPACLAPLACFLRKSTSSPPSTALTQLDERFDTRLVELFRTYFGPISTTFGSIHGALKKM